MARAISLALIVALTLAVGITLGVVAGRDAERGELVERLAAARFDASKAEVLLRYCREGR